MSEIESFDITWRGGAYRVSVANFHGGKVYTEAAFDRLTRENDAMRKALEEIVGSFDRLPSSIPISTARAALAGLPIKDHK